MFYLKLAWNNIKTAKKDYAPFVLASFILYSLTCSILLILLSPLREGMSTGAMVLPLGLFVLAILSLIMEIYSYRVLLKQRSREFGLYNILGMNKQQVGFVSTLELTLIFLILIVLGSAFSSIFANFLYLIFVNVINYDQLILTISPLAFILNALIFSGIFLVLALVGLHQVGKTSPLSLFRSQEKGEKEPRGNLVLAFLSLIFIGGGYGISIYSKDLSAITVLLYFFIAVLLVIMGTYLFYVSFIAWYLKKRRSNKNYFYQPKHFITTSQMIFRMKQHATGLASITLLAVMAFVSIGTTSALYLNTQNHADLNFPMNTKLTGMTESFATGSQQVEDYLHQQLGADHELYGYTTSLINLPLDLVDEITVTKESMPTVNLDSGFVYIITQDDFRGLGNELPQLQDNQVAFYKQKGNSHFKRMNILGKEFQVIENLKSVRMPEIDITYNGAALVVANAQVADDLRMAFSETMGEHVTFAPTSFTINIDLTEAEQEKLGVTHNNLLSDESGMEIGFVQLRQGFFEEAYAMYGGLLFTGVLLGLSFLLGAALIIYYKQYSEGQEDKKSYKILQEVGMSKEQVKKTISSQTLLVFFMPLGIAALHYLVAIPMLRQMLLFFGVSSSNLVYLVAGGTMVVISILYYGIYRLTSRAYYRMIER
ncbi:ABC transporter permease [Streptococcus minor]|uniref:ABC transporter permease n=1 Tax=Streptococcus minor TaxID=229549 RepID=UPI00036F9E30|nr:ABC transporter permease [Streptococcus minor]